MLKRNWSTIRLVEKIFFVGISQLVDVFAMLASAGVIVWLKRYPHLGTQTADDVLLTGFMLFVVAYMTIAVMMGLYRGSFHLSLSLQNMIMARSFILSVLVTLTIVSLVKDLYIDRPSASQRSAFGRHGLMTFLFSLPFFFVIGKVYLRRVNLFFQKLGYGVHNSFEPVRRTPSGRLISLRLRLSVTTKKQSKSFDDLARSPSLGIRLKVLMKMKVSDTFGLITCEF
jgi:hypothetical protein